MVLDNPFMPDLRVLKEAQTLIQEGHEVTIYAWDRDRKSDRPSTEFMNGIKIIRIKAKSDRQMGIRQIPHYFSFAYKAFRLILKGNYDVVHCHDLPDLFIGVLIKLFKNVNLVYDAHEIYWLMEAKKYPSTMLTVIRKGEINLLRKVDAFITVGYKRASYYEPYYKKPIYVVGNWYNPVDRSVELAEQLRRSLSIPQEDFILSYAGTLSKIRGTDLLIEISKRFSEQYPNCHLVVAGDGPAYNIFTETSANNSNLHFLGWLEDTSALFSASNALIYLMDTCHPYAQYNSPNTLYLSIAWGLPLIGINAGEIAAILSPIEQSTLVNNLDINEVIRVIERLVSEREFYEKVREKVVTLQTIFNWERAEDQLLSAYDTLL